MLLQAMSSKFDNFYLSYPKVSFSACKLGYLLEYKKSQKVMQYQGWT
jgi:N-acetylglucosamine-6-sulfatase